MISQAQIQQSTDDRRIGYWLLSVAAILAVMVMVGGLTRLTESGLSITEWQPITGVLPPIGDEAWAQEFAKYQTIPQYKIMNPDMTVDEFKSIFLWEWAHRLLGRLIGLAFAVPAVVFAVQGRLKRRDLPRMVFLFALGGLQGALGWWMVQSGLADRINVSQYRLAAHLGLALIIYAAIVWTALDRLDPARADNSQTPGRSVIGVRAVIGLCYLQILMGAIVAGLRAGMVYNTWPLMNGSFLPDELLSATFTLRSMFEDPGVAQFAHRIGAYLVFAAVIGLRLHLHKQLAPRCRRRLDAAVIIVVLQMVLGIITVLGQVPLVPAAAHQFGAVALLTALIWSAHGMRAP